MTAANSHPTRQDEMEKTRLTVWKLRPQVEFNNAVKENNTHSLRHGAKKSNIEKNQNPRIIPCELYKYCSLSQLVCRWLQPGGFGAGGGSPGQRLHQRLLCRCKPTILVISSSIFSFFTGAHLSKQKILNFLLRAWYSRRRTSWPKAPPSRQCPTSGGWFGRRRPPASSWSPGHSTSSASCELADY